ncbi:alcohol dehydrogenase catalytic domain-containing protein [Brevibacterium sandarakinum]|uniref:alcohol dehydrogenase catalytic domain-containing protein n=1 Tax=Brevibacterium sandarakinum TaxID=629680 RepID=UPI00264FBE2D|nr:alcohol dehydrogenase catalytic domain-containing protein [Brevibacterium sandarakinum]MDN5657244.1 alcohol dehydrogenase catalytic domain-containing protein [Brevibacterium sandarakinum]
MRAIVYEEFSVLPQLRDIEPPSTPATGVVIDVEATGVCRSDHHAWSGHDSTITLPHVPGHELVGRIASAGHKVTSFHTGQRVTVPFVCGCGRCRWCLDGNAQVCPDQTQPGFTHFGSWADQVVIHNADANLIAVPEELPASAMVGLGCRFATAFHGLRVRAELQAGETVAVFGCGGVGLSAIMIARAIGAQVVAIDVSEAALDRAREHGATHTVNAAGKSPGALAAEVVSQASDQCPDGVAVSVDGVAVSVDALGREDTIAAAIASLAPLGRHVQIGLLATPPVVDMSRVIGLELSVLGSHGMAAAAYPEMVELVIDGKLRPQDLVTNVIGLEDAPAAMDALGANTGSGMTIIDLGR